MCNWCAMKKGKPPRVRKSRIGRCVHCLRESVELTKDHVFPASWYPDDAPPIERWTVPSCKPCNAELGRIEGEVFVKVGACLDPNDPVTAGLVRRTLRAMDPREGTTPIDQRARARLLKKFMAETKLVSPDDRILPPFNEKWGRPPEEQVGIKVPESALRRLGEKITRGIHYLNGGRFIEPSYEIGVFLDADPVPAELVDVVEKRGEVYANEPGIVVRRFASDDEHYWSVSSIELWSQWKIWVTVGPKHLVAELKAKVDA